MQQNDHILGDVSLPTFLQEYWQQKPLLIRNALPDYVCPISADEMAGLACESEVESRIIVEHDGDTPWQCHYGPFEESQFSHLPETHWTLLLQSCNLHIVAFSQLLERFRFIPNWRVDDVMVSYAAPGGSVGPHLDNYDVFLLQAQGIRHWDISTEDYKDADFVPDLDLKILKSFSAEKSWKLEAGDMLYLPPGVAHHGVADSDLTAEDCITVSIGFRAPNGAELATALLDEVLSQHATSSTSYAESDSASPFSSFYSDPNLDLQKNPGEISRQALENINTMVQKALNSRIQDGDWFGKYITNTGEVNEDLQSDETLSDMRQEEYLQPAGEGQQLVRNESSKLVFFISDKNAKNNNNDIHFFCNGHASYYPQDLLPIISLVCNHRYPPMGSLADMLESNDAKSFLANLINQGHLYYEQDADDNEY
ncbi:FIG002776: hypothetical protein [hydrothermal vent metagenome]|uniref:JmjC domain-containing protein n=1 Tax=hydrothermal vent metagenome TaxID=652676 RepID=A0A3B1A9S4_9ZZZZ